ncbi:hypothetical protein HON22_04790 [Candidatus Peregrinibacteria bacterium]|jgi:hypothetical protein|nr:hypothetical protein [Candidatus Peregrinibacteria bacterium]
MKHEIPTHEMTQKPPLTEEEILLRTDKDNKINKDPVEEVFNEEVAARSEQATRIAHEILKGI